MPELPEVETVARQLACVLPGQIVQRAEVLDRQRLSVPLSSLAGYSVVRVFRLGKQVILEFRKDQSVKFLAVHLRMTGRLIWTTADGSLRNSTDDRLGFYYAQSSVNAKHVRARFTCDGGELEFIDTRRFGTLELAATSQPFLPGGADPLEANFTVERLARLLETAKQPMKPWLLRQDRIVGIGNIYACEILFAAKLSPYREARSLSRSEVSAVHRHTIRILEKAIENCGTTFSDFQVTTGDTGNYQSFLKVYDRAGEPCRRCRTPVERIVQAQRSTFFCPRCQA